jgi:hypothetical protein
VLFKNFAVNFMASLGSFEWRDGCILLIRPGFQKLASTNRLPGLALTRFISASLPAALASAAPR